MKIKKIVAALFYASALTTTVACNSMNTASSSSEASSAIASAEAANKAAKNVNYEWRDTGKVIKKAKAADKAGDTKAAIKLANKAEKQAQIAAAQYVSENKRFSTNH